jgi:hypothetical protein
MDVPISIPLTHAWDLIQFIKFQAFPFTPDELKQHVCKRIANINIYRPEFHLAIESMIARNAFCEFERFIRHYKRWNPGYFNAYLKDIDILMHIFWNEPNESIAYRLMRVFMIFPMETDELRTIWNVAINILYSKTSHDDTVAALTLLESYVSHNSYKSNREYVVIEPHDVNEPNVATLAPPF